MIWSEEIKEAIQVLEQGGIILFPTDTIWGIGCDATNDAAVRKLNLLKDRPVGKGYVLLAADTKMVSSYVEQVPPKIDTLLSYHVRPLTVIYNGGHSLSPSVIAPDSTVAFRIPLDQMCKDLLTDYGKPIVATSANVNGQPFAKHFGEISSDILLHVDKIFNYRRSDKNFGTPSIIAKLNRKDEIEVIRH